MPALSVSIGSKLNIGRKPASPASSAECLYSAAAADAVQANAAGIIPYRSQGKVSVGLLA